MTGSGCHHGKADLAGGPWIASPWRWSKTELTGSDSELHR